MIKFRLDRTAFKMQKAEGAGNNYAWWKNKSYEERLEAAFYLNSVAFNFDINDPPLIDRTYFRMRKRK